MSVLYVASRLFLTLSLVYMPLYLVESLGEQAESLATVPLVAYVASFLASLGVKVVSTAVNSKVIFFLKWRCSWKGKDVCSDSLKNFTER